MKFTSASLLIAVIVASAAALSLFPEPRVAAPSIRFVEPPSTQCTDCKSIVSILVTLATNGTEWKYTKETLTKMCDSLFSNDTAKKDICALVIDAGYYVIPLLLDGMNDLAWNIPLTVCSDVVRFCYTNCCNTSYTPQELRLSYVNADDLTTIGVTWVTLNVSDKPKVRWMTANTTNEALATWWTYTRGGWLGTIYRAVMTNLPRGATIRYQVGSDTNGMSRIVTFRTLPVEIGTPKRPLRVAQIADMGYGPNSDNTVRRLSALAQSGAIDLLIHPGDVSYADGDEGHWDIYFTKVESISSVVPYMLSPGNHELWWDFDAYRARIAKLMPVSPTAPPRGLYYRFSIGPVTLLSLDSESTIDTPYIDDEQIRWINAELPRVNRTTTPWLWVMHHRPLYCASPDSACSDEAKYLRSRVEQSYVENNVDVAFAGHLHYYERTWPMRFGLPTGSSYTKPQAPVYITNGAAGNREGQTKWAPSEVVPAGSSAFGFALMNVTATTLEFSFIDATTNAAIDSITITK